ncbi:hypothetical protein [Brevibacterium sp. CS2]|uniref:hypothetical protein n=1 Tax=Brevibacterium sp. CS2 TaxID=2575923 RepID=UPI0010C78AB8|nr:hypothetical protein [Brevibacterium sp. CS2]QCP04127.1 hypothetical protein FDF13_01390 [Brevibacterium sp. CS2]
MDEENGAHAVTLRIERAAVDGPGGLRPDAAGLRTDAAGLRTDAAGDLKGAGGRLGSMSGPVVE